MEKTKLYTAMFKKLFHNLTTCKPDGSWNNTQMVVVAIILAALVLLVGHMEYLDHARYGI